MLLALPLLPGVVAAQHREGAATGAAAELRSATQARAAAAAAEDARYYERALALRRRILARASWAALDSAACNPGFLRLLTADTAAAKRDSAVSDVETLERIIVAGGIDGSLDTPAAHDLLRTVVAWEAAAARPAWDVQPGEVPRRAIAAALSGQFFNPQTKACESYPSSDTLVVVLPSGVTSFTPPKLPGVALTVVVGQEGLNRARDAFYAARGASAPSIFSYTRIRAAVVWRDFAVVAVNRPAEARAVVQLPQGAGGAAYIFHHAGGEWRLLAITRTWG
jgi:hypothetical protein